MAITIQQNPIRSVVSGRGYVPTGPCVWSCSSSNVAQPNFKFLVQIYDGATEVAKFVVAPNQYDRLHFDAWEVNKPYIRPDVADSNFNSIHYQGTTSSPGNKPFITATNSIKMLEIRFGEKYDVAGVPTEFPGAGTLGADAWQMYILPYRTQYSDGLNPSGVARWTLSYPAQAQPLTKWRYGQFIGPNTSEWSLGTAIQIPVTYLDYGVISFPHDGMTIDQFNDTYSFEFQIYNGNITIGTSTITINATNGAAAPNSTTASHKLIYAAAYPKNLSDTDVIANPLIWPDNTFNPDWTHYRIIIRNSTSGAVSNPLIFYRIPPDNCRYDTIRLAWVNDIGGWDYFNFTKRNEKDWTTDGKTYDKVIGTFGETTYYQPGYSRSTTTFAQNVSKVYTLTSDYISEGTFTFLRDLFTSREVHIVDTANTTHIPVQVVDKSYKERTIRSANVYNVTLQVKLAQPLNI